MNKTTQVVEVISMDQAFQDYEMQDIRPRAVVTGTVTKVEKEKVELNINAHSEGIIYKDYLTKNKIESCSDFCKVGDELRAQVSKSGEDQDILLTRIPVEENELVEKIKDEIGSVVKAKVIRRNKGGLTLSYKGATLFLPVSLIDTRRPSQGQLDAYVGQELEVELVNSKFDSIVCDRKKLITTTFKKREEEEFNKLNEGDVVTAKVVSVVPYGCFCKFGNLEGLLHISQISHQVTHKVEDKLAVGDEVEVKVISKENKKISLSIKALTDSPMAAFLKNFNKDDVVTGTVTQVMDFGLVLNIGNNVTGLLHRQEYAHHPMKRDEFKNHKVGDKIEVKILDIIENQRKISLSKKALDTNPWDELNVEVGAVIDSKVVRFDRPGMILDFNGFEVLIPYDQLTDKERTVSAEKMFKLNEVVQSKVTRINHRRWQIVASIKELTAE